MTGSLTATREALHAVAEHVLAAARYQADGRIGLVAAPGGFATPPFGPDARVLAVVGTELVLRVGGVETRSRLTTVAAAADFAGIAPGAPANVYTPVTALVPDAPLVIDEVDAARLERWWSLGSDALVAFADEIGADADPTLWPEHFDIGIRVDEVNYGVSPGDEYVPVPYLYVGPDMTSVDAADPFWDKPFGATLTDALVKDSASAVAFFRDGRGRAAAGA